MFRLSVLYAGCFYVGCLLTASVFAQDQRDESRPNISRPNIVVILSDDMGFSDLGCYGGEIETPHLDRLATGGLRFTQFYNTARCCPTRASLLTGLYPHQAGVGHMMQDKGEKFPGYRGDLNDSCRTIAEVLRGAGYSTYASGKWHVTRHTGARSPRKNWPRQRGFDRFYGIISGGGSYYDPFALARDNELISPYADPEYQPERYYFTEAISDQAVRFIGEHQAARPEQPFFLYVAYTAAHWPLHAFPEDIARYRGKYDGGYEPIRAARREKAIELGLIDRELPLSPAAENWASVGNKEREAACMEVYAAMVDRMDQGVGKIVAELARTEQLENTLVLYLQDNGGCAEVMGRALRDGEAAKKHPDGERAAAPSLPAMLPTDLQSATLPPQNRAGFPVRQGPNVFPGPDDTFIAYGRGWANVSNTPFREYKHWVHEGGISTPLIAHWPRGFEARGELRKQPTHLIDIAATCYEIAGAVYPQEATPLEGQSLVPAFQDQPLEREALYWEHEGNRAVRQGDWKAVAKGPAGAWELYDLSRDRIEVNDLAAEQPEKLAELVGLWEAYAKRTKVLPWIWKPAYVGKG